MVLIGVPKNANYSPNMVLFPINNTTIPFSCRGWCFKTHKWSPMLECMCDNACMFLVDCCYDYLLECNPWNRDISAALHEQYSVFCRLDSHRDCVNTDIPPYTRPVKTVHICPSGLHNGSVIESKCKDTHGKGTISTCVPVESDWVLYRNTGLIIGLHLANERHRC